MFDHKYMQITNIFLLNKQILLGCLENQGASQRLKTLFIPPSFLYKIINYIRFLSKNYKVKRVKIKMATKITDKLKKAIIEAAEEVNKTFPKKVEKDLHKMYKSDIDDRNKKRNGKFHGIFWNWIQEIKKIR